MEVQEDDKQHNKFYNLINRPLFKNPVLRDITFICVFHHLFNWILGFLFSLVGTNLLRSLEQPLNNSYVDISDSSLRFPHEANESINFILIWSISFLGPFFIITFGEMISTTSIKKIEWISDAYNIFTGLAASNWLTQFFTEALKSYFLILRPYFLEICRQDYSDLHHINAVEITQICTASRSLLENARRSWPSGHTSQAASASIFIILYLGMKFKLWNQNDRTSFPAFWKVLLTFLPLMFSVVVGGNSVITYRHSHFDTISGFFIGTIFAILTFKMLPKSQQANKITEI